MVAWDLKCLRACKSPQHVGASWVAALLGFLLFTMSPVYATSEWVRVPDLPTADAPGDVGSFLLQNISRERTKRAYVTFGTVFGRGAVKSSLDVSAHLGNGRSMPVQIDAKTHYADGSIRFAVITAAVPPIAPAGSLPVVLVAHAPTAAGTPQPSLMTALKAHDLRLRLTFYGANGGVESHKEYDISTLFSDAQAKGFGSSAFWRKGALATEVRVQQHIVGSLRLVIDLTALADGSLSADIQFNNDIAMSPQGGTLRYSVGISSKGKLVFDSGKLVQHQYQAWHVVWRSAGKPPINIVHDVSHLARVGAIPNYQIRYGLPAELLRHELKALQAKGWGRPLAANGVVQYMPMTGGRPDIGPVTGANAIWLITQRPVAAAYALGQADAAGAVPWHFYLPGRGRYLTTLDYPNFWADPRGGRNSGTQGLTQRFGDGKWHPDAAHVPSLAYVPYLLTGRRYYLDQLNAEALYVILGQWPAPRLGGDGILVGSGAQVRGAAWSLREVAYAAYANPSDSYYGRYFRQILDNNIRYLKARIPQWTREEGETYGYVFGSYGAGAAMPPWQQDFLATSIATTARLEIQGARDVLLWQMHFLAGSLQARGDWNPRDGIAYNLGVYNPDTKVRYKTWAEVRKATEAMGQANGSGWSHSKGYYGMLRMASLASIYNVTGSREALAGYRWVEKSGAPGVSRDGRARQPQYWIVPRIVESMTSGKAN
ncbi:MAG: hypothetical protein P8011_00610 [Acidihalobacter sp.]|uniref:RIFT barrel domain-containing protein n=1 Tax=Acidihalobacter sp. TaxID=1872108 RepID=UPI00307FAA4D